MGVQTRKRGRLPGLPALRQRWRSPPEIEGPAGERHRQRRWGYLPLWSAALLLSILTLRLALVRVSSAPAEAPTSLLEPWLLYSALLGGVFLLVLLALPGRSWENRFACLPGSGWLYWGLVVLALSLWLSALGLVLLADLPNTPAGSPALALHPLARRALWSGILGLLLFVLFAFFSLRHLKREDSPEP